MLCSLAAAVYQVGIVDLTKAFFKCWRNFQLDCTAVTCHFVTQENLQAVRIHLCMCANVIMRQETRASATIVPEPLQCAPTQPKVKLSQKSVFNSCLKLEGTNYFGDWGIEGRLNKRINIITHTQQAHNRKQLQVSMAYIRRPLLFMEPVGSLAPQNPICSDVWGNLCHFIHKFHMIWPGIELEPSRWVAN
jgi:hypothetical protein